MHQVAKASWALRMGKTIGAPGSLVQVERIRWAAVLRLVGVPVAMFNSYDSTKPCLTAIRVAVLAAPIRPVLREITTTFIKGGSRVDYVDPAALADRVRFVSAFEGEDDE